MPRHLINDAQKEIAAVAERAANAASDEDAVRTWGRGSKIGGGAHPLTPPPPNHRLQKESGVETVF